jgi:drug/metabolite transporter (DMT)-like permease
VNNVVLVGRLEPPLTLALSVWLLRERVSFWEVAGAIAAFVGVILTIILQPPGEAMMKPLPYLNILAIALSLVTPFTRRYNVAPTVL